MASEGTLDADSTFTSFADALGDSTPSRFGRDADPDLTGGGLRTTGSSESATWLMRRLASSISAAREDSCVCTWLGDPGRECTGENTGLSTRPCLEISDDVTAGASKRCCPAGVDCRSGGRMAPVTACRSVRSGFAGDPSRRNAMRADRMPSSPSELWRRRCTLGDGRDSESALWIGSAMATAVVLSA